MNEQELDLDNLASIRKTTTAAKAARAKSKLQAV